MVLSPCSGATQGAPALRPSGRTVFYSADATPLARLSIPVRKSLDKRCTDLGCIYILATTDAKELRSQLHISPFAAAHPFPPHLPRSQQPSAAPTCLLRCPSPDRHETVVAPVPLGTPLHTAHEAREPTSARRRPAPTQAIPAPAFPRANLVPHRGNPPPCASAGILLARHPEPASKPKRSASDVGILGVRRVRAATRRHLGIAWSPVPSCIKRQGCMRLQRIRGKEESISCQQNNERI